MPNSKKAEYFGCLPKISKGKIAKQGKSISNQDNILHLQIAAVSRR